MSAVEELCSVWLMPSLGVWPNAKKILAVLIYIMHRSIRAKFIMDVIALGRDGWHDFTQVIITITCNLHMKNMLNLIWGLWIVEIQLQKLYLTIQLHARI